MLASTPSSQIARPARLGPHPRVHHAGSSFRGARASHVRAAAIWDKIKLPFAMPSLGPSPQEQATKYLLEALEGTERGLNTDKATRESIEDAVEVLEGLQINGATTGRELSATWSLLWTTEQETLWILKNAGLFKTEAGEVYQVIDTDAGTLQNVITFPPEGAFIVDSAIEVEGEQRTAFQFTSATLKLPNDKKFKLPPFGKGWFDTVYMGKDIRISRDVRGDILICRRDGPPRKFE